MEGVTRRYKAVGGIPVDQSGNSGWRVSAQQFLDSLFEGELADETIYDSEIVALVKGHLGTSSLHSRAGVRLGNALVQLAKARAAEKEQ